MRKQQKEGEQPKKVGEQPTGGKRRQNRFRRGRGTRRGARQGAGGPIEAVVVAGDEQRKPSELQKARKKSPRWHQASLKCSPSEGEVAPQLPAGESKRLFEDRCTMESEDHAAYRLRAEERMQHSEERSAVLADENVSLKVELAALRATGVMRQRYEQPDCIDHQGPRSFLFSHYEAAPRAMLRRTDLQADLLRAELQAALRRTDLLQRSLEAACDTNYELQSRFTQLNTQMRSLRGQLTRDRHRLAASQAMIGRLAAVAALPTREKVIKDFFDWLMRVPGVDVYQQGSSVKGGPFYSEAPRDYDYLVFSTQIPRKQLVSQVRQWLSPFCSGPAPSDYYTIQDRDGVSFDISLRFISFKDYCEQELIWRSPQMFHQLGRAVTAGDDSGGFRQLSLGRVSEFVLSDKEFKSGVGMLRQVKKVLVLLKGMARAYYHHYAIDPQLQQFLFEMIKKVDWNRYDLAPGNLASVTVERNNAFVRQTLHQYYPIVSAYISEIRKETPPLQALRYRTGCDEGVLSKLAGRLSSAFPEVESTEGVCVGQVSGSVHAPGVAGRGFFPAWVAGPSHVPYVTAIFSPAPASPAAASPGGALGAGHADMRGPC